MNALGRVTKPAKKRVPKEVPKLPVRQAAISIDDEFEGGSEDVIKGIKRILSIQWGGIPDQLNTDFKEHIEKYRKFVPRLVSRSHLYSLFLDQQSLVDRQVNALLKAHKLVRVQTQNSQIKGDLLMLMDDWLDFVDDQIVLGPSSADLLFKFKDFITKTDISTSISKSTLSQTFTPADITTLQRLDFLSLVVRDQDNLLVSVARFGFIVSLYSKARQFVTRQLSQNKWKEIKHEQLTEKWEKNKLRFKDFKGLNLQWVLHYMIGEGVLEAFATFDGTAYKLI